MLAAWLFAQYLLTNDVQIAYAETEGYVPVTAKARADSSYQDYLAAAGSDNNEHYDIKILASRLLLDNVGNTFTTPVFNGSTSLRDAAGQLIENVTKSVRRKETVDDAYLDRMFDDVMSLYRLDQLNGRASENEDLGPLPLEAKALLGGLAAVWVLILIYAGRQYLKNKH